MEPAPAPLANANGQGTILVVDDDILVHDLIGRSLSKEGYRVLFASSGEQAIQLAREQRPQAITIDALMPEFDGWGVLKALKADSATASIPVIMFDPSTIAT